MIMTNDISLRYMASTAKSSACLSRYMYAFLSFYLWYKRFKRALDWYE